jgi:transposase InsO family protein
LGIVDYHGSRLIALEVLPLPTSQAVAHAVGRAIVRHGAPKRILTDNGPVFLAPPVQDLLARHAVMHTRTRPAHPWTKGDVSHCTSFVRSDET